MHLVLLDQVNQPLEDLDVAGRVDGGLGAVAVDVVFARAPDEVEPCKLEDVIHLDAEGLASLREFLGSFQHVGPRPRVSFRRLDPIIREHGLVVEKDRMGLPEGHSVVLALADQDLLLRVPLGEIYLVPARIRTNIDEAALVGEVTHPRPA